MTSDALGLEFFIGNGLVDALVDACLMINYEEFAVGWSESLSASGEVRLTYDYKGEVIPTPAAFAAGLTLIGGMTLRRRRG